MKVDNRERVVCVSVLCVCVVVVVVEGQFMSSSHFKNKKVMLNTMLLSTGKTHRKSFTLSFFFTVPVNHVRTF